MVDLIVPRRLEDRSERYKRIVYKKIQDYIKNGSKGDLYLYGTPIESLPSNLKTVGGDLNLSESKILELPEGLKVGGNLWLAESNILILPNNLTVGKTLGLSSTKIDSVPINLKVYGNLRMFFTPLSIEHNSPQIVKELIQNNGGFVMGVIKF